MISALQDVEPLREGARGVDELALLVPEVAVLVEVQAAVVDPDLARRDRVDVGHCACPC